MSTTNIVDAQFNRAARTVTLTVRAPESTQQLSIESALAQGADWYPLQLARELDDAILHLRTNELDLGLWLIKTAGNADAIIAIDDFILANQSNWFVRETLGMLRRTLARLDVTSRSMYAIIEPGSCFAGTLFELALASDRIFIRDAQDLAENEQPAFVALSKINFGALPMPNHLSRLQARHNNDDSQLTALKEKLSAKLNPQEALDLGLVTVAPDDLDWEDELRQAIESRAALSPDGLTGLEANLRFGPNETTGDPHLRPPLRLAKLDFHPPQRSRPRRRPKSLRHRRPHKIQLGARLATSKFHAVSNFSFSIFQKRSP